MMKYADLPLFIQHSTVFNAGDIDKLLQMDHLPDEGEVDDIRHLPEIQELTNAFIGDDSTRNTHLQLKAKDYLRSGEIEMAWKVILL